MASFLVFWLASFLVGAMSCNLANQQTKKPENFLSSLRASILDDGDERRGIEARAADQRAVYVGLV